MNIRKRNVAFLIIAPTTNNYTFGFDNPFSLKIQPFGNY